MSPARFRLAATLVLIAALAVLLVVQWQVATALRSENAALRQQAAALAEEARATADAAVQQAAERERQRTNQLAELLALRGEVARLRRELARPAVRPSSVPLAPEPATPVPEPAGMAFSARMQAVVPAGHTIVAGGWEWSDGRRGLLLVTPTAQAAADGTTTVEIEHKTVLVPDALLDGLGLAALRTDEAASEVHGILDTQQATALNLAFEESGGVEHLALPHITTADGRPASIGLSGDHVPYVITFEVTPTVNSDGQIKITAESRAQPRPPVPGR